jgi:2'-5' RNA ligase
MVDPHARLFVALMLGDELGRTVRERVVGVLDGADFRFPRAEGLHLTLAFLGDVERGLVEPLRDALAARCGGLDAPALRLGGGSSFPGRGRERVLWIGVSEAAGERLEALWRSVLDALDDVGQETARERGRGHRPHVTVARPRGRRTHVPGRFYDLALGLAWSPREVCVVESVRADGPQLYRVLARVELEGTG